MTILVPEIGAGLEAEHIHKNDITNKVNETDSALQGLTARVEALEDFTEESKEEPLFTTRIYGGSDTLKPFDDGEFLYCDIVMIGTLTYSGTVGTRNHNIFAFATDGTVTVNFAGKGINNLDGSGEFDLLLSFSCTPNAILNGEIIVTDTNNSGAGTSTFELKKWIVRRYKEPSS